MLPNLDEWDVEVLEGLKGTSERAFLELKGSALVNTDTNRLTHTKAELAKQVCAFSNSGAGFLVLGVDAAGLLDEGVPRQIGREDIKAWIEKQIPDITFPSVHKCEAKLIVTNGHAAGKCVLVLYIPLSELRPHWIKENSKDIPYIRAGEHSSPMPLQTFRDMIGRSETTRARIVSLGSGRSTKVEGQILNTYVWPKVELLAGSLSRDWLMTLEVEEPATFYWYNLSTLPRSDVFSNCTARVTIKGQCPLIRGAQIPLTTEPISLALTNYSSDTPRTLKATLHVPGAEDHHCQVEVNVGFK